MAKPFPVKDIQRNTKVYNEYEFIGMEDGWYPKNKQQNYRLMLRLPELAKHPLKGASVLDVGCGKGDFSKTLRQQGVSSYLGIDINQVVLETARERHPDELFLFADLLSGDVTDHFDFVFCSGALTLKLTEMDNYEFFTQMIQKMWNVSKVGVVFNVLTDEGEPINTDLFFYNPEKVYTICSEIVLDNHILIEPTNGVEQIHVYLWRD
jgi:ubiquinone/menaquinone biosynthesis C-methylase UbiE